MILINLKHMQVLSEIFVVLAAPTSSSNATSSDTLSSVNTTQGMSTVPSVSSVTGVNETTGEGSHGSTGDVYIFAILTNKIDVYKFQAYSTTNLICVCFTRAGCFIKFHRQQHLRFCQHNPGDVNYHLYYLNH